MRSFQVWFLNLTRLATMAVCIGLGVTVGWAQHAQHALVISRENPLHVRFVLPAPPSPIQDTVTVTIAAQSGSSRLREVGLLANGQVVASKRLLDVTYSTEARFEFNPNDHPAGELHLEAYVLDIDWRSAVSVPVKVVTAPSLSIVSPVAGSVLDGVIRVRTSIRATVTPQAAWFTLDDRLVHAISRPPFDSFDLDTTALMQGAHTLTAHVIEASGRERTSSVKVTLENRPAQIYVGALYYTILRRPCEPAGLNYWSSRLASGVSYFTLARELTASDEARRSMISRLFQQYLNRAPEPAAMNHFLQALSRGALTRDVRLEILASDEYYAKRALSNPFRLEEALYRDIFHRSPDLFTSYWAQQIVRGTPRAVVVKQLLNSEEGCRTLATDLMEHCLRQRGIDPEAVRPFTQALQAGTPEEDITAALVSSDRYLKLIGL